MKAGAELCSGNAVRRAHKALPLAALGWLACGSPPDNTDSDAMPGAVDANLQVADAMPCDSCPVFVNDWGGYGLEPGQFVEPSSIEIDSQGTVIVAGHENRVQRFTKDGVLIDIFGVAGPGDGEFNHPHGLAVDRVRGDRLYVGDQENHRLQVFTAEGSFIRQWGDPKFAHIHDVGIDPTTGDIFVGDLDLDTVRKFSSTGEILGEFGGPGAETGMFNGVWGISTDSNGFVYVADTNNRRIQKLDSDGQYVKEWSGFASIEDAGTLTPFIKPTGVYVDRNDVVYVCDAKAELVVLFDSEGARLAVWDLAMIYGKRSEPEDIVIDAEGKHIYIAEVFEHRVLHLVML